MQWFLHHETDKRFAGEFLEQLLKRRYVHKQWWINTGVILKRFIESGNSVIHKVQRLHEILFFQYLICTNCDIFWCISKRYECPKRKCNQKLFPVFRKTFQKLIKTFQKLRILFFFPFTNIACLNFFFLRNFT